MGYAHYCRRVPEFGREAFKRAAMEIAQVIEYLEKIGVPIAGPAGKGRPECNGDTIAFNGLRACGHRYRDIGKPWPADGAEGIALEDAIADEEPWAFGAHLKGRACGGSCAGDPFVVDRRFLVRPWDRPENGLYYAWCETSYRPYDLAVTAALIRLKEHFGNDIVIESNGGEKAFADAKRICRELFGFASRFEIRLGAPQVVYD